MILLTVAQSRDDYALVYLDLSVYVTEEYPVVPLKFTVTSLEERQQYDSAEIYLKLQVLGGECYSTWSASNVGDGDAFPRWSGASNARWSGEGFQRWSTTISVGETIHC